MGPWVRPPLFPQCGSRGPALTSGADPHPGVRAQTHTPPCPPPAPARPGGWGAVRGGRQHASLPVRPRCGARGEGGVAPLCSVPAAVIGGPGGAGARGGEGGSAPPQSRCWRARPCAERVAAAGWAARHRELASFYFCVEAHRAGDFGRRGPHPRDPAQFPRLKVSGEGKGQRRGGSAARRRTFPGFTRGPAPRPSQRWGLWRCFRLVYFSLSPRSSSSRCILNCFLAGVGLLLRGNRQLSPTSRGNTGKESRQRRPRL